MSNGLSSPDHRNGYTVWHAARDDLRVAFVGRGPEGSRDEVFARIAAVEWPVAWLRQVHGNTVVEAATGCCGEGDALVTDRDDLPLAVATADCVPVVLARGGSTAVVHAGWRGVVARVVAAAVDRLGNGEGAIHAWIGPAIGPCCYEVGEEVASAIQEACGTSAAVLRPATGKPHVDLTAAVERQLLDYDVDAVERMGTCTRCATETLWSYRRDGPGGGRNLGFAWRAPSR